MSEKLKNLLESYFDRLWPKFRSLAGPEFRNSLDILSEIVPFKRFKFKTGSKVLDWIVPREWYVREAYFMDLQRRKYADIEKNNLHLVSYSVPFKGVLPLSKLRDHLHSLPDRPDAIPYITSYYKEYWGFCISHNEYQRLPDGDYFVKIDSRLSPGHVEIGEAILPGKTKKEVLFSSYLCHPSLANNELSGPLVLSFLYDRVRRIKDRLYTYRFVIVPETIGTLCYLSMRGAHLVRHLMAGYIVTCVGDRGNFTYKQSRQENTLADRAARLVLGDKDCHIIVPFDPGNGSEERQYCSPGFNLPVGSLMRSMYSCYPEYHTSKDDKSFVDFDSMIESISVYYDIVRALESNRTWVNKVRYGEPQLGRRGLYPSLGNDKACEGKVRAMMWLLNLADGENDLFAIAEKSGESIKLLQELCEELYHKGLLEPA
ncbi:MAG: DUF4910 domain-containing protein [Candidatus Eremiobacteraeota bacterium]|nr:DUF4910 domain-containing protein [Candidatus Eremiobacteraeota bacterium]